MTQRDRLEETETLLRRLDVLERFCRGPARVRDLVEETERSRSTINRAVNELEEAKLIERREDAIAATTAGCLVHDRLRAFLTEFDDIQAARAVLAQLSPDTEIGTELLVGSEAVLGADPTPYRAAERLQEALLEATAYQALVPTLDDPRHVRLLYEHVVTNANPAELVVTPAVFETLREEFSRQLAVMREEAGFTISVGQTPPFGLVLLDRDGSTTVYVVIFDERRRIHGLLVNDNEAAVQWASKRYETHRAAATDPTDAALTTRKRTASWHESPAAADGPDEAADGHDG